MKKYIVFSIGLLLALTSTVVFADINLPETDKQQIVNNMDLFVEAVNKRDSDVIMSLISTDNTNLRASIQNILKEGISYQFNYYPLEKNIEVLSENTVKISGRFASSGPSWSANGLSNFFIFEKTSDEQWLINNTDFAERVGWDGMVDLMKNIFIIVIPIFLIFFIFWLLMLVDCIKRNFEDKALWVVLMLILGVIASILYYFMIKKKNITRKPLEFKM